MARKRRQDLLWAITFLLLAAYLGAAEPAKVGTKQTHKAGGAANLSLAELRALLADYPYGEINYRWGFESEHRPKGPRAREVLDRLRRLSDEELASLLSDEKPGVWGSGAGCELCLSEIIRRGGKKWEAMLLRRFNETKVLGEKLEAQIAALEEREGKAGVGQRIERLRKLLREKAKRPGEVEFLTVLRRLQRRNDPLMILVAGKAQRECKLGYLPSFDVRLTNVDVERKPVRIFFGGDYRSGRRARWRFEVRDAEGVLLPPKILIPRGGLGGRQELRFGESWVATMPMSSYVAIERPGEYTVQILCHDSINIDGMKTVEGLVCCPSVPIKLTVKPIEVEMTQVQRQQIAGRISKLPERGPVKVHGGVYCEGSHEFIPPDTPAGKLLAAWWKAFPQLVEAANSKRVKPVRRAWVLGLLASIAGQHDPRKEPSVLGPYEYRHSGWSSFGGFAGDRMGGGFGWESMSVAAGTIDAKKQLGFAKRWLPWVEKRYVRVKIVKAGRRSSD